MTFDEYWKQRVSYCVDAGFITIGEYYEAQLAWDAATKAATAWRPMDEARKDGTPLLLYARARGASASCAVVGWFIGGRWIEGTFTPNVPTELEPTGWLPLPEPMAGL